MVDIEFVELDGEIAIGFELIIIEHGADEIGLAHVLINQIGVSCHLASCNFSFTFVDKLVDIADSIEANSTRCRYQPLVG